MDGTDGGGCRHGTVFPCRGLLVLLSWGDRLVWSPPSRLYSGSLSRSATSKHPACGPGHLTRLRPCGGCSVPDGHNQCSETALCHGLSTFVPVRLCTCPSPCLSVSLSLSLSVSVSLSLSLCVCVPAPLPDRLCPCPLVSLSTCVSVHLCLCPLVSLSTCVPVHLCPNSLVSQFTCVPIHLCPCLFVSPSLMFLSVCIRIVSFSLFVSLSVSVLCTLSTGEFCQVYFQQILWQWITFNAYFIARKING
jgi:hypothetical protein